MRVYLTGGSGLLGSHLAERLRARGAQVVCLLRKEADGRFLQSVGCVLVEGDVRAGPPSLAPGMRGADVVVHAAALVYKGGSWPRLRAVNVEGTEHVLRAAVEAGVPRALHVSSVAVYGGVPGPVDEDTSAEETLAPGDLYARSKRAAESVARRVAAEAGLSLTVVRPCALYGERDRMLAPRLARWVSLPRVPLLGEGTNTVPVVYAGNAADALARLLEARAGGVYDLGEDWPLTQRGMVEGMAHALGRRARTVSIPAALARGAARLAAELGVTVPGAGDLGFERVARLALGDNPYGSRRLRDELGWTPPYRHGEGLARTAAWLKGSGGEPPPGSSSAGQDAGTAARRSDAGS